MAKRKSEELKDQKPKARLVRAGGPHRVDKSASPTAKRGPSLKRASRSSTARQIINELPQLPTEKLNVYVWGTGTICELGLGPQVTTVKRPRINKFLLAEDVGVVKLAVGGAHVLALDFNGELWTWGQNDSGVLGRVTSRPETKISVDENGEAEPESDSDDEDLVNPLESTPMRVEGIPSDVKFVDIAASDNLSAAISNDGKLWAWGTFIDDGNKSFRTGGVEQQNSPTLVSQVKHAVQLATGKDHLLILDRYGDVYAWGVGQNYQLGHAVNGRLRSKTFGPLKVVGLKNIKSIAAGEYHSFALDHNGKLWAWGLNNFGQCGIPQLSGEGSCVEKPTQAHFFDDKKIVQVDGGNHHSMMLTASGQIYTVGETNFHQLGIPDSQLPSCTVRERSGAASYVPEPTVLSVGRDNKTAAEDDPSLPLDPLPTMRSISCGLDHSLAIADDGTIWTWGFGAVFQLGHGNTPGEDPDDEPVPTHIRNTASAGVDMVFVGAGGQFSCALGKPKKD